MSFPVYLGNNLYCAVRGKEDSGYTFAITNAATTVDVVEVPVPVVDVMEGELHKLGGKYVLLTFRRSMLVWHLAAGRFTGIIRHSPRNKFIFAAGTHVVIGNNVRAFADIVIDVAERYGDNMFVVDVGADGVYREKVAPVLRIGEPMNNAEMSVVSDMPTVDTDRIQYCPSVMLSPTKKLFYVGLPRDETACFRIYDTETKAMTKPATNVPRKFVHVDMIQISPDRFMMTDANADTELTYMIFDKSLNLIEEACVPSRIIGEGGQDWELDIAESPSIHPFGNGHVLICGRNGFNDKMYVEVVDIVRKCVVYMTFFPDASNIVHTCGNKLYINYFTEGSIARVRRFVIGNVCRGEEYVSVAEFMTRNAMRFREVQRRMEMNRQREGSHAPNGKLALPVAALRNIQEFL